MTPRGRWRLGASIGLLAGLTVGLSMAGGELLALARAPVTLKGELVGVTYSSGYRGSDSFKFKLASGRRLSWSCAGRGCRDRTNELKALRWETPLAVTFRTAGDSVVGLTTSAGELLSPDLEGPHRTLHDLLVLAIFAVAGALGGIGLAIRQRTRSPRRATATGGVGSRI